MKLLATSPGSTITATLPTALYAYNANGLLYSTTRMTMDSTGSELDNEITILVYASDKVELELDGDGEVKASYTYGSRLIKSETAYYVFNGYLDVVQLTDLDGIVIRDYDYDPYGVQLTDGGEDTNPFRYKGELFDSFTGFIYLRARFYDPELGRFISADPYWNAGNMIYGDSPQQMGNHLVPNIYAIRQSTNLYAYAINNPVRFFDPRGLAVWAIHGTWSDPSTWTRDFQTYVGELFNNEKVFADKVEWDGKNNKESRLAGAEKIFAGILAFSKMNPDEPIRLVGHSHGGNVAILIINMLAAEGVNVETLVTFGTPVRSDYQLDEGVTVGQHINIYNATDFTQLVGAVGHVAESNRTYEGAINECTSPQLLGALPIYGQFWHHHGFMHSNIDVWKKHVAPHLK